MSHTYRKPQDPPAIDASHTGTSPTAWPEKSTASPWPRRTAGTRSPTRGSRPSPCPSWTAPASHADDAYYDAFWSLRNGDLRLNEAGDTMYARDTNWLGGDMPNTWHPISSLSEEFGFPTGSHAIRNLEPMFKAAMLAMPRLTRGMRFGNTTFHVQDKHTVAVGEATENCAYLYVDNSPWLYDRKKTARLVEQANRFIAQLTADDASRENLLRMFATPFLEPYKHLFYVFYGHGGDGKSFLLGRFGDAYPDKANGISVKASTRQACSKAATKR
mgnify:CR=1 FL=1